MRGSDQVNAALLAGLCWLLAGSGAAAADRLYYRQAQNAFYDLPARERNEIYLELMATGDFVEMASSDFNARLYDATARFQDMHAIQPSGVLTPETRAALSAEGGRIFNSWGMGFLDHPLADAAVAAPNRMALEATRTRRGVALENKRHTMSVAFAFFRDGEATLQSVFDNLTRPGPGNFVAMQVLKPEFLAVAGNEGGRRTYSRYIPVPGGIAGFTLTWNPSVFPNADRIAVVMANELYPRRMAGADMFAQLPTDTSPNTPGGDDGLEDRLREDQAAAERKTQQQADQEAESRKSVREAARQTAEDQARRVREADDARKAKAEADRRIAQEQIEADHLASAKVTAEDALKDAVEFVKSNHDDPQLLDHLQAIADLKTAATGSDPDVLDRGRSRLQAQLKNDPVYAGWEERQIADRRRAEERDLRDTLAALSVQKRFLVDQVASDPTGANAGKLLDLVRQVDAVSAAPALVSAQSLAGRIDAAIQEANLGQKYGLARSDARKQADEGASSLAPLVSPAKP